MNTKTMAIVAVALIVVAGASFFGGMKYQDYQRTQGRQGFGMMGNRNNRFQGRGVVGQVTEQDDKSITIKRQNGQTSVIFISDNTKYSKTAEVTKADVKKGDTVMVIGTESSDGSVNAQTVQINPQFRGPTGTSTR